MAILNECLSLYFVILLIFRFDHFNIIRQGILLSIDTFGVSHILPILGLPFLVAFQYHDSKKGELKDAILLNLSQVMAYRFRKLSVYFLLFVCFHLVNWTACNILPDIEASSTFACHKHDKYSQKPSVDVIDATISRSRSTYKCLIAYLYHPIFSILENQCYATLFSI